MKQRSKFSQGGNQTLFESLLVGIFLVGLFVVAAPISMAPPAFAAEPPETGKAQAAEKMSPGDKGGHPKDCEGPPVTCVGVDVALLAFPGCTSGQRCSLDTTGKSCGLTGTGKTCQTVNSGGVCSCQCIK